MFGWLNNLIWCVFMCRLMSHLLLRAWELPGGRGGLFLFQPRSTEADSSFLHSNVVLDFVFETKWCDGIRNLVCALSRYIYHITAIATHQLIQTLLYLLRPLVRLKERPSRSDIVTDEDDIGRLEVQRRHGLRWTENVNKCSQGLWVSVRNTG